MAETGRTSEYLIPGHWPADLPMSAKWEDEVEWVHQSRGRCIKRTPAGNASIDLFKARSPAPSEGALGIMQMAADDPKMFNDVLLKVKMQKQSDSDEAKARKRHDDWLDAEMMKVLRQYD